MKIAQIAERVATALVGVKRIAYVDSERQATPEDLKNKNLVAIDRQRLEQLLRESDHLAEIKALTAPRR